MGVVHWDDAPTREQEKGHIGGRWTFLGEAAGAVGVGLRRMQVPAGHWSTPVHFHGAEEEIFFVLGGSGLSWQDDEVYEVGPGDCLVHPALGEEHSLRGGPDGLDVLAFGERIATEAGHLPRAGISWYAGLWVDSGHGDTPWEREAAAGEPAVGEPAERPARIVNLRDVERERRTGATVSREQRDLGRAAGSQRTGLKHVRVDPRQLAAAPHCHSAEEELFVVLEGDGELELTAAPSAGSDDERHAVRAGSVVARPAGSRVSHAFRAGDGGLTLLAYGTRRPNDVTYYPRSQKVFLRGLGVIARMEHVPYWDGED